MCVCGEQVSIGGSGPPPIVIENGLGPALPAMFVAVTLNTVVPAVVGRPEKPPPLASVAHDGKFVPLQVIGVVPEAVNI